MEQKYSLVMTTCPGKETAKAIARLLVEQQLAACGQIFSIESIYTWQDKVHDEPEFMLLLKTKTALMDALTKVIKDNHPYEVPEIIQLPIMNGFPAYLDWINSNTI